MMAMMLSWWLRRCCIAEKHLLVAVGQRRRMRAMILLLKQQKQKASCSNCRGSRDESWDRFTESCFDNLELLVSFACFLSLGV